MKTPITRTLSTLALLTTALTIPSVHAQWDQAKAVVESQKMIATGKDPLPGPRTCFWARGPVSADPYINVAYPDAATFYWAAVFTIPEGARLHLEGNFPRSRYMSLISYDSQGVPIESVADYLIPPNPGAVNPFLPGADRTSTNRGYRLAVVDAKPPANQPIGMNLRGQTRDTLNAPKYGTQGQQTILYRIYVGDKGTEKPLVRAFRCRYSHWLTAKCCAAQRLASRCARVNRCSSTQPRWQCP